jgi:probable phosphoglycerate mutase
MIYLLRHGEIQGRERKRYIGRTDVGLSEAGVEQALGWKRYFSTISLDAVVSSLLSRALETACLATGLEREAIVLERDLAEIDLGDWDGRPVSLIRERHPLDWEARGRDLAGFRPPGGESFQDLRRRVMPVFTRLAAGAGGNLLVVAHAGVNRVILAELLGRPLEQVLSIPQDYAALNLISTPDLRVVRINRLPEGPAL